MANTSITSELLDSLLAGRDPKTVFAQDGLLDELKKALAERILYERPKHKKSDTPKQTSLHLRLRALHFYPNRNKRDSEQPDRLSIGAL